MKLPAELRSSKKWLINIKNNDQKSFIWCHIRHINPIITQEDKKLANVFDYDKVELPVQEKDFSKIEKKNNICINVFCYKDKLTFPIYISNQKLENSMDLLLLIGDDKSHYGHNNDFNRFMFHKTRNKNKKCFWKTCLQCFSSKHVLTKHKEVCLSINGAQSRRLEKGTIEFKKYFKQILVPFKIHAGFECNLKSVESYEGSDSNKYQDHILCSLAYKLVCVDDKFTKPIVIFTG